MNIENLNKLIQRLEQPDAAKHFNMVNWFSRRLQDGDEVGFFPNNLSEFFNTCHSAACVAGWCEIVQSEARGGVIENIGYASQQEAKDWLDISYGQAVNLFEPERKGSSTTNRNWWNKITLSEALETLRRLRDTGEVRWPWQ